MSGTYSNRLKKTSIGLFLLGFLLYAYTISFDYAQDDAIVIKENMFTQKGLSGIEGIFSYDTFYGFFKQDGKDQLVQGGRYRPATLVTFAIEHSIFANNPHVSHFINALLYGFLCTLVFLFAWQFFYTAFKDKSRFYFALACGVVFAVHPVHTEVVANIKGRDEIFVALFSLLSLYLLIRDKIKLWHLGAGSLAALIAFFSKENAIALLVLFPLAIWISHDRLRNKKSVWLSYGLVLLAGVFYLIVRSSILGQTISQASTELMNNSFLKFDGSNMTPYSFEEKWSTIIYNLLKYIGLYLFPYPLTSDYYPYHITAKSFTNPWVIISILIHGGMLFATAWGLIKQQKWVIGLLIYFGYLFLVSNVPFNIGTNISERFLFVPSIGLGYFSLYFLIRFLGESPQKIIYFLIPVGLLFSSYTVYRSQVWKNDFILLTTDVKASPNSAKALHAAGGALSTASVNEDDPEEKAEMIRQSNEYLNRALEVYPLYINPNLLLANNYYYLGDYDKAIAQYETLLQLDPDNENGLQNMAVVYRDAGRYYGEKEGNLVKSIQYLKEAYKIVPDDYETVRLLGVSHGVAGDHQSAVEYFKKATEINPEVAFAWFNLSRAHSMAGNETQALSAMKRAVEIDPEIQKK